MVTCGACLPTGAVTFHENEKVFAKFELDQLWYAATFIKMIKRHEGREVFVVKWAEDRDNYSVKRNGLISASALLKPGTRILVPEFDAKLQGFGRELVIKYSAKPSGQHFDCTGKRGWVEKAMFWSFSMEFEEIVRIICRMKPKEQERWSHLLPEILLKKPLEGYHFVISLPTLHSSRSAREELQEKVQSLGGRVHTSVGDLVKAGVAPQDKVLLSPRPSMTCKYFQALLARITCVSLKWIDAIFAEKIFRPYDPFLLEAGYCGGLKKKFLQSDRPRLLFHNLQVGVYGLSAFSDFWKSTIEIGEGHVTVLQGDSVEEIELIDLVLVDSSSSLSRSLWTTCRMECVQMISEDPFIESIISGRKQWNKLKVVQKRGELHEKPVLKKLKSSPEKCNFSGGRDTGKS